MKYITVYIFCALLVQTCGAILYFKIPLETHVIQIFYLTTKLLLIALPIPYIYKKYHSKNTTPPPTLPNHRTSIYWGIITGIGISLCIIILGTYLHTYLMSFSPFLRQKVIDAGIITYYIPFSLFLSIFHAGLEEYYWRWFAYGLLTTRVSTVRAIIITNIAFSLHHVIILSEFVPIYIALIGACGVLIGGIIWSLIYTKTNSLLGNWISHILVDMSIMYIGYTIIF